MIIMCGDNQDITPINEIVCDIIVGRNSSGLATKTSVSTRKERERKLCRSQIILNLDRSEQIQWSKCSTFIKEI